MDESALEDEFAALEGELDMEAAAEPAGGVSEDMPAAPVGAPAAVPAGMPVDEFGLPAAPRAVRAT